MKKITTVSIIAIIVLFSYNQNAQEKLFRQVEIPGTQLLTINSSIANQEYNLYINLPRYFEDTTRTFPVIYLLDAQWDFPLLNAIYGEQYYDGFLPEAITVGITWGGENPNYDDLRRRDFTPSKFEDSLYSGEAEKFLSFIEREVIPFVESEFRVKKDDRTLIGSSLGGLFTLYAMFNKPEIFNKYVLTSPAIGWDSLKILSYEKSYSEKKSELPVKLFMAIGEYEDVNGFQKFAGYLEEKNYKGLKLKTRVLDGIGHSGSKAEGYTRGLQFVFEKNRVNLLNDILKQYAGTYQIDSVSNVYILLEGNSLVAEFPGNGKIILYASGEKDFFVKGQYLKVHFIKDDNEKITSCRVEQYSGERVIKKIN